jgi:hypothetical protein
MSKKDNLDTDFKAIRAIFEKTENEKDKLGLKLVDRAVFMQKTLKNLEQNVEENGEIVVMCQGSYSIDRQNPALTAYTGLIKQYSSIVKQIIDLLPVKQEEKEDLFDTFE